MNIYKVLAATLLTALALFISQVEYDTPNKTPNTAMVTKIIDGDTIEIGTGERVRYIGINTPEYNECYGKEATEENSRLVLNKQVKLLKDKSDTDKYDRLLRYVYIDDTFINLHLVKNGFAEPISYRPDTSKQNELNKAKNYAIDNKLGIWNCE